MSRLARSLCFCAAIAIAPAALAQPVSSETGWLELVKGHLDPESGAAVHKVEPGAMEGERKITLAIPKERVGVASDGLEEVRVIGRRPEAVDILPDFRYEWVADYDNDHYGLIIHLRDDGSLPLRLYMDSATGFTR
ncbi:hypothetical protein Q6D67_16470 [Haliea sp. E1-2-M8]|uniref:hypothetical protein n=1 Tax=Haliea sp. E1-2-M8 TaxID=3064706 RepID=UPI002728DD25|nr:hypothetical protein [Haliea sp. E1-2-M8]MDO8863301.1 hypothetical protein [Haliea sp. E1-2-M8]